jgi:hypothetical protein
MDAFDPALRSIYMQRAMAENDLRPLKLTEFDCTQAMPKRQ